MSHSSSPDADLEELLKAIRDLRTEIERVRAILQEIAESGEGPLFHGKGKP